MGQGCMWTLAERQYMGCAIMPTEQELFWKGKFGSGYAARNDGFDQRVAAKAWRIMLRRARGIQSVLECGSNIGRNLGTLRRVLPRASQALIEIFPEAYRVAVDRVKPKQSFCGSILESHFKPASFDLVFTCGVLIHIAPGELEANCRKIVDYSKKYVLVSEYFNRTPVSIDYHGQKDKLFKRDFGKFYLENFKLKLVDYGFLWSHEFEAAGFDDMTWWLFCKK